MVNRFMARLATAGGIVQAHQLLDSCGEQTQQLSAGTVQPENQPSDNGSFSGWFVGIALLAAVLLVAAFFRNRPHFRSSDKRADRRVIAPAFTSKDRSIIELLSEIVDIISFVEK